jgi:phosphate transport system permease protein
MEKLSFHRKLKNATARGVFSAGGIAIIILIILILSFLAKEVTPLLSKAKIKREWTIDSPKSGTVIMARLSDFGGIAWLLYEDGHLILVDTSEGNTLQEWTLEGPPESIFYKDNNIAYTIGRYLFIHRLQFVVDSQTGMEVGAELSESTQLLLPLLYIKKIGLRQWSEQSYTYAISDGSQVVFWDRTAEESLLGETEISENYWIIETPHPVFALNFYPDGDLLVSMENGQVHAYNDAKQLIDDFQGPSPLTAIAQLIGGRGICLGGEDGSLGVWAKANTDEGPKYLKIHTFKSMPSGIRGLTPGGRDRTFIAWDKEGRIHVYYSTTEDLRLAFQGKKGLDYLLNPKSDILLGFGQNLQLTYIDNPHPDINLKTMFSKVWYEGFPKPAYIWQSTGAANDFEPKLSLIPLILGTLKGTLYALIFALPLALTGALFMNQFMHPNLHRVIKPVIEIMAGLPSVIIGFLAGLWLAPILEQVLPGVLLGVLLIPLGVVVVALALERFVFKTGQQSYKYEIFVLLPFIALIFILCVKATPFINDLLFQGDFKQYIFDTFLVPYDQRNAVVVGFAMGFAVIPIIFSLAEDALSFVPKEITAGSLALGLSRWQTATGVVLKAARSGIFSAVMLGLGRAVGETMIVLMATGNTPVLSFFPFNGFRTFSANIAVELPEAPVGGTLYRILFLTAFLLLLFTLVINTAADIIRSRMRKKLGQS